jgi:hypothetical protein
MGVAEMETAYKLPIEWIDRIFQRLTDIYGVKFTSKFSHPDKVDIEKARWRSGLYGLNSQEIKKVLNLCLNNEIREPPNVIEFYHYGKNYKSPPPPRVIIKTASPETASKYMDEIRKKLNGSHRNTAISQKPEC